MAASGVSPARLLRPFAILSAVVFAIVAVLYIQVLPWSFGAIENLTSFVQADFISNFAHPGAFSNLQFGFVFHYRERTPDGALRGVFMQDRRDPAQDHHLYRGGGQDIRAERRELSPAVQGVLLRPQSAGDSAIVSFDDYTIDLSQFMHALSSVKRPRERTHRDLMRPDAKDQADPALAGHIRSELLDRLASPLYALRRRSCRFRGAGGGAHNPSGTGRSRSAAPFSRFVVVRMLGITATTLDVGVPAAAIFRVGDPDRRLRRRAWPASFGAHFCARTAVAAGFRHDRQDAIGLFCESLREDRNRRVSVGLRPYLRCRSGGIAPPIGRFASRRRAS